MIDTSVFLYCFYIGKNKERKKERKKGGKVKGRVEHGAF